MNDIIGADDVGAHGLHRKKFATWHFLECRSVKYVIDTEQGTLERLQISDISDIELHFTEILRVIRLQLMPHIMSVLLTNNDIAISPKKIILSQAFLYAA